MKKLLLTLVLVGFTLIGAQAQGTINPLNNPLFRLTLDEDQNGTPDRFATAADGFVMNLFYGPANASANDLTQYPQFAVIGDYAGIFTGLPTVLGIPGTDTGDIVSVQMRFSNPLGWQAETKVIQVTLMPAMGPGAVVWGSSGSRMGPVTATSGPGIIVAANVVPEPSTLALGALAGAFLLFRVRKATNNN